MKRVLAHKELVFTDVGQPVYKHHIEWHREDGSVAKRSTRLAYEDGNAFKPVKLKYEQVPA